MAKPTIPAEENNQIVYDEDGHLGFGRHALIIPYWDTPPGHILIADKSGNDITPARPYEGLDKLINTGYALDSNSDEEKANGKTK
jgi:hypothetical protein